MYAESDDV